MGMGRVTCINPTVADSNKVLTFGSKELGLSSDRVISKNTFGILSGDTTAMTTGLGWMSGTVPSVQYGASHAKHNRSMGMDVRMRIAQTNMG